MNTKTLDCPIEGLTYTEHSTETHTYYTLEPDEAHKMRVRSMDTDDEDGNVEPCYLRRLAFPRKYDFETNKSGIESEQKE